jgi:transposase
MKKYIFNDFNRDFPTDDTCLDWLLQSRWPEGVHCEKCDQLTKHHRMTKRPAYACDRCGSHVYPLAGTIMERSSTSLRLWFYGMFLMASTRCGISAKQLERELGVTYKTAWRMFKQIRSILDESAMTILFGAVDG